MADHGDKGVYSAKKDKPSPVSLGESLASYALRAQRRNTDHDPTRRQEIQQARESSSRDREPVEMAEEGQQQQCEEVVNYQSHQGAHGDHESTTAQPSQTRNSSFFGRGIEDMYKF